MKLTPFEIALYFHVKRRAGDNGVCNENCRELAAATQMSAGQVSAAKNSLKERGLIEVKRVKGRDVISVSDIWQENLKHFAPHLVECSSGEQTDQEVNKLITVRSKCSPGDQSDQEVITPPHPPIRIQERLQEPSARTIQELSLSPRAGNPSGTGGEPERERDVEPRWKTKYTLDQVVSCARSKGLGDGWVTVALETGKHDWQIEQHLNPPLPLPPTPVLLNPKDCPDCDGTNFYSPGGPGKGVARCPHTSLLAKLKARADVEANGTRGSPEAATG
ncbi:MAG: hypothetical protein QOG00_244 [Pyrinomonadaceae bacterium]|nr:hypothetical protein [Pyrinomonadaceae bacterium]